MTTWPADELAWARECLLAGDAPDEIAAALSRDPVEVARTFGRLARLTPLQREVLSLYAAGCSFPEIDAARGFVAPAGRPGKAAAARISHLRNQGLAIPHRNARPA